MRISMLMRDTEYRDAMIDMISQSDREIFVEIADGTRAARGTVILTDICPDEIDRETLARLCRRTVFLSETAVGKEIRSRDDSAGVHRVFKYSCLQEIMSELSLVYAEWTGNTGGTGFLSRCIAVITETDLFSSERCRALARQIVYRHGGHILILPMGYLNDYSYGGPGSGTSDMKERYSFERLMYMINEERDYAAEGFTYTDSYGISYLMTRPGLNPIPDLDAACTGKLLRSLSLKFDTVILDIGTCFRKACIEILNGADKYVTFFVMECDVDDEGAREAEDFTFLMDDYCGSSELDTRIDFS